MFDLICIFTTGGVVLWYKAFCEMNLEALNILVKNVMLEEKTSLAQYNYQNMIIKWRLESNLDLVFAIIYKEILQILYVDSLLDMVRDRYVAKVYPSLQLTNGIFITRPEFDSHFAKIFKKWEMKCKELQGPKKITSFAETEKGKRILEKKKNQEAPKKAKDDGSKAPQNGDQGDGKPDPKNEQEEKERQMKEAREKLKMRAQPKDKKSSKETTPIKPANTLPERKDDRNWGVKDKVTSKDIERLDQSDNKGKEVNIEEMRSTYLDNADAPLPGFVSSDESVDISDESSDEEEKKINTKPKGGLFSKLTSRIKNFTGNKVLSQEDLAPVLKTFAEALMEKNVAQEIATSLCDSVQNTLLSKKTESFTTVKTTVKNALKESIHKLLTPKRNIDILKDAIQAKNRGTPYVIVFIGVNGVGKSTTLAKVAYLLTTKGGLKVSLAACDNFRSGAVEQLKVHAKCLGVPCFDKGYKDEPSNIAREAIAEAKQKGYDVVLVDTAGRMQHNEPLMKELAKLVHFNNPDIVLFVGEALVGNDAIDQLTKFNQSLIDFAYQSSNPRTIDGIVLSKFDTVDDKVGAAISMIYSTGKPIVFVGVGQKYPHLKKLNANTVINSLMN